MKKSRRSSIITIIIVLILLVLIMFSVIAIINYINNRPKSNIGTIYHSNLDEEDMMQYEFSKLNDELNGIYAFAISDGNLVAIKDKNTIINIIPVDTNDEYDYLYNNGKLYLLDKNTGVISIIPLKTEELNYYVEATIQLDLNVDSFQFFDDEIYFISKGKLLKYENGEIEEVLDNVTSKKFVIKNDNIYIVKENKLIVIDQEKNENVLADNAEEIYYYDYYERNKLIYDTQVDEENKFKNIYNFYTNEINNSIRNDTYFIPYLSGNYVYLSNDKTKLMFIDKNGNNSSLYSSDEKIDNISFIKEGYIIIEKKDEKILIDLEQKEVKEDDKLISLKNITYIK